MKSSILDCSLGFEYHSENWNHHFWSMMASSIHQARTLTRTSEKTGPLISDLWKNQIPNIKNRNPEKTASLILNLKYQRNVKEQTDLIFRGLTFQNKYIDAGQQCVSLSVKCRRQQANELSTLDVEGKSKRISTTLVKCSSEGYVHYLLCNVFCFHFLAFHSFYCNSKWHHIL